MEPICTRFTENEVGRMDDSRQERTRSSFIRAAVAEKIEREGLV